MPKATRDARFYTGSDSSVNLSGKHGYGLKAAGRPDVRGGSLKQENAEARSHEEKSARRRRMLGRSIGEVKRRRDEQLDEMAKKLDSGAIEEAEYRAERSRILSRANSEISKLKAASGSDGTSSEEIMETRRRIAAMRARKAEKGRKKLANKIASANERFERGEIDASERDRIIDAAQRRHAEGVMRNPVEGAINGNAD